MRNGKLKLVVALLIVAVTGVAYAQSHNTHTWRKTSETTGTDRYGRPAVICTWECVHYSNERHSTQTQGVGHCPSP